MGWPLSSLVDRSDDRNIGRCNGRQRDGVVEERGAAMLPGRCTVDKNAQGKSSAKSLDRAKADWAGAPRQEPGVTTHASQRRDKVTTRAKNAMTKLAEFLNRAAKKNLLAFYLSFLC